MAEAAENFSSDAADVIEVDENVKFAFQSPEVYKSNLTGTDNPYDRHLFLCYGSYESWPPRVEESESDQLPKLLSAALKARKNDMTVKTRLTICEGREGTEFSDGDVLIFPEMIKYRGLKDSDVDSFVEDVLVNGKPWGSGVEEVLSGSHVFVCAHASRDQRCGVCGPVLIEKFKEEVELKGLKEQVFVSACSHVGGHKYAGNLIIFSPDQEGNIAGHWYGYVTPNDVAPLLEQHIGKGEVIKPLWSVSNQLLGQLDALIPSGPPGQERRRIEGNEQKKKRMKPDTYIPWISTSMRGNLDAVASLKGEQVAARVTQENAEKHEWFVVKVIHFDRETREFEVLGEEPGDDEEGGGQRKYKLPVSHVIPFPKRNDPSGAQDFPTGKQVLAVYPGAAALYKATVVQPRKTKAEDYVLEFDDDEEEDGSMPQRVVPFHRVVGLPEGHRQ